MIEKDKYDEMMVQIENRIFDVQILLCRFITAIMEELNVTEYELDGSFPFIRDDGSLVICTEKIIYDNETEDLMIISKNYQKKINWTELDISILHQIANEIHMKYVSDRILKELSSKEEVH